MLQADGTLGTWPGLGRREPGLHARLPPATAPTPAASTATAPVLDAGPAGADAAGRSRPLVRGRVGPRRPGKLLWQAPFEEVRSPSRSALAAHRRRRTLPHAVQPSTRGVPDPAPAPRPRPTGAACSRSSPWASARTTGSCPSPPAGARWWSSGRPARSSTPGDPGPRRPADAPPRVPRPARPPRVRPAPQGPGSRRPQRPRRPRVEFAPCAGPSSPCRRSSGSWRSLLVLGDRPLPGRRRPGPHARGRADAGGGGAGLRYLVRTQNPDGSWTSNAGKKINESYRAFTGGKDVPHVGRDLARRSSPSSPAATSPAAGRTGRPSTGRVDFVLAQVQDSATSRRTRPGCTATPSPPWPWRRCTG